MTDRALNTDEHIPLPMSQQEHEGDDLEEHRERVRELLDEHRGVFDDLAN